MAATGQSGGQVVDGEPGGPQWSATAAATAREVGGRIGMVSTLVVTQTPDLLNGEHRLTLRPRASPRRWDEDPASGRRLAARQGSGDGAWWW